MKKTKRKKNKYECFYICTENETEDGKESGNPRVLDESKKKNEVILTDWKKPKDQMFILLYATSCGLHFEIRI